MATLAVLIFILLVSGKVDSAIDNLEPMKGEVGEVVDFLWNASITPIIGSQWGLRDSSGADNPKPLFISTTITSKNVTFGNDLDTVASSYKNRVHFIGNLSIGRAWFRITDLKTSDTNQYRVTIQENLQPVAPFTVSLTVLAKETTTSTPSTTSRVTTGNYSSTTTKSTPSTTTHPPTTTSPEGLSGGQIAGIAIGAVIGVIIIIIVIVVIIKKFKKSHQDNLPADKKQDTEMKSSSPAKA